MSPSAERALARKPNTGAATLAWLETRDAMTERLQQENRARKKRPVERLMECVAQLRALIAH